MLADIQDGPERDTLHSETGYIDAGLFAASSAR